MDCRMCGQPIVLIPSASERARKYGGTPSDYTKLFTVHARCELEARASAVERLVLKHTNPDTI